MAGRAYNSEYREREHLTKTEVDKLITAAKKLGRGSNANRNELLLTMMFRHGLRVSEAVGINWEDLDLDGKQIRVRRLKGSISNDQPLQKDAIKMLKKLPSYGSKGAVFVSEAGKRMTASNVRTLLKRAAERANIPISVHPHMLRHSCGFHMASQGKTADFIQYRLGHKSIANSVIYVNGAAYTNQDIEW